MNGYALGRGDCGRVHLAVEHEWLITNGLGGYASGTVCEINTRRYHGLLMAALTPPTERTLLVSKLDIAVRYRDRDYPLFSNEYADGTITPAGFIHLESFQLDRGLPVWRYAVADALIEKRMIMRPGSNTTLLNLHIVRASDSLAFTLTPLCTYRDYHGHSHGHDWKPALRDIENGVEITAFPGARSYRIRCDNASFTTAPIWHWHFKHRAETDRGLDDTEDLFRPGYFTLALNANQAACLELSDTESQSTLARFNPVQQKINTLQQSVLKCLPDGAPPWICQLALAADQFIVERHENGQATGKSIIAGYPWFTDWGRDTMIALPGLTLALGRYELAANIIQTYARHISAGMLPNRFPDQGTDADYNTVDATLWFIHAIDRYTHYSADFSLSENLYPILTDIIEQHRNGTRYGIRVDKQDGLLQAGEPGMQLTWMDAKAGDWVVTPRIGKCVEINALWYNALQIMSGLAARSGDANRAADYRKSALQVNKSIQRFWNPERNCLFDVIDGPEGELRSDGRRYDTRLRPNQLFAVSLPHSALTADQQKAVVVCCAQELLTSYGLRSLAAGEAGYTPCYRGDPRQRDGAYHQGTVWSWLIGPFVDAHYLVYQNAGQALSYLEPFRLHLHESCMGQISEIFDANPPFTPRGCFAQAWSVAEILRIWLNLNHRGTTWRD